MTAIPQGTANTNINKAWPLPSSNSWFNEEVTCKKIIKKDKSSSKGKHKELWVLAKELLISVLEELCDCSLCSPALMMRTAVPELET